MNILIVDDNNDKIARIVTTIRPLFDSFQIDSATDIVSAKQKLSLTHYDLMLLDLCLPLRQGDTT